MKRTNVVLDEQVLAEAIRLSGERTYSSAINRALREMVQRIRARGILSLQGSGLWEGDLAAMRGDDSREQTVRRIGRAAVAASPSSMIADHPADQPAQRRPSTPRRGKSSK
jgi:Arc/MetJ family transcription regulator